MADAKVHSSTAFEDSGHSIMARVIGNDAASIVQSDITSIAYKVRDLACGEQTVSAAMTVATVVFDTLQTDARWTVDLIGYNFRYDVPASELPNGSRTYRFEIVFTPSSGQVFTIVRDIHVINLVGS